MPPPIKGVRGQKLAEYVIFDKNALYRRFLASDVFIIHFKVNLTSERQLLWSVAQIVSTFSDFTDKVDFWQVEAKTVFFYNACAIFVGE